MPLGPFDLTAGPFLALYAALLVIAAIAGFIIPIWLRPEGRRGSAVDTDQLAWLAGGRVRFAETLVTRLLAKRALGFADKTHFRILTRAPGHSPAEAAVLTLRDPAGWPAIASAVKPHARPIEAALVRSGLVMAEAEALRLRLWQTLPYLVLIGFGSIRLVIGSARGHPVGYLAALMVLTAAAAALRWFTLDRRTLAGHAALVAAKKAAERLRRAPTNPEIPQAVALFGTAVLIGSGWSAFHTLRSNSGGGDGGGDDTSGGGCGGGGCGGCS